MIGMVSEQVHLGDVRIGSPIYPGETSPLEIKSPVVRYAGQYNAPDDTLVWVIYEGWLSFNPWLKKGIESPRLNVGGALGGLIAANDHYLV